MFFGHKGQRELLHRNCSVLYETILRAATWDEVTNWPDKCLTTGRDELTTVALATESFYLLSFYIYFSCVWGVWVVWRSEDNLSRLILSFYHVFSGVQTQSWRCTPLPFKPSHCPVFLLKRRIWVFFVSDLLTEKPVMM